MDVTLVGGAALAIIAFGFVEFGDRVADRLANVDDATQELLLDES